MSKQKFCHPQNRQRQKLSNLLGTSRITEKVSSLIFRDCDDASQEGFHSLGDHNFVSRNIRASLMNSVNLTCFQFVLISIHETSRNKNVISFVPFFPFLEIANVTRFVLQISWPIVYHN